jgi:hypothetical protein
VAPHYSVNGLFCDLRGAPFAQALAGELDAVGVVHDAIENGVSERWIPDHRRVPLFRVDWWLGFRSSILITRFSVSALI